MPQPSDIELDGAGYMVAPGTYRRMSDGLPEGRTGRVVVKDFFGGQRQALELVRDRSWDARGVGPGMNGQGVEPWPYIVSHADGSVPAASKTQRMPGAITSGYTWLAYGRYLYKSIAISASSWASFLQDEDFGSGAVARDLAAWGDNDLAIAFGASKDIQRYDTSTGLAATVRAGRKGDCIVGYGGYMIWGGQESTTIRIDNGTNQDSRSLDSRPVRMALHAGKVAIATRLGSLYLLSGKWDTVNVRWSGDPEPLFTHGVYADDQDFAFLISFGGKLYTWLQGTVMEFNPNSGSSRQGWRAIGLEGRACYGATVAANMLVVATIGRSGDAEVWAWDGSGWWLIWGSAVGGGTGTRCWPMFLAGAGSYDLLVFRDQQATTYDLYRMAYRNATFHNYNTGGQFRTSLLDAGERDKLKAWRKVGCTFAAPEVRGNDGSSDPVTVELAYSLDGGATWTTAVSTTVSNPATRTFDLEATLANAAAVSRFLMLQVTFSSVLDWSPTLTGLWAEYELLGSPAGRRKWSFKVQTRDATVQRDGSLAARTGRQLAADLWANWSAGTTLPFKDLDYDATAQAYQVRIVGIHEEIAKPSDRGRWGESTLALTLVEI